MSRTDRVTPSIHRPGAVLASVNQGIYEQSSTQKAPLGTRMDLGDGRVFYYALNGSATLMPGKLTGSPINKWQKDINLASAVSTGAKELTITAAAIAGDVTASMYSEGYLTVVSGFNLGQTYKIYDNDAIAGSATGKVYLYDAIALALDTTSDVILTQNMFRGLIVNPDVILFTVGVPLFQVTASYYFWIQTWGPAGVLCGDSTGNAATERWCNPASTTGEFVTTAGGVAGTQIIGDVIYDSTDMADTEYHLIYLTCCP